MGQRRVASPVTATTDLLAPDIVNMCGRAFPAGPSKGPDDGCGGSAIPRRSAPASSAHHLAVWATWPAGELERSIDGGGSRFCHIPPPGLTVDPDARTFCIEQTI